ncbi:MAG: nucleotidyl transferase AbiEii/AbiGii toxin family protein [Gammaproteobacteria bacterium]|nr:nucleotidyl transferase AbiEii/AbiGii toxin family protein [Gammaproteobacteria bacterium]
MASCAIEETEARPIHDDFMDDDMRRLWRSMGPLPGALRLYGGTALALYLHHRESVDFDFFTPAPDVRRASISALPWLADARLRGGDGVIEATCPGADRDILVTFLEVTGLVPPALDPSRPAPNGVPVASPRDLVRAKLEAICNRGAAKDYADIAAAFEAWPEMSAAAFYTIDGRSAQEIAIALANPPADEHSSIDAATMAAIRRHAVTRDRK